VQGFSNFFIPNLATVHLQARGHSPPLTATRPCGRLRVAAPPARSLRSLPAPRVGWRRPVRLPPQRRSTPAAAPPPACAGPCGRTPLRRSIPASEATAAAPHAATAPCEATRAAPCEAAPLVPRAGRPASPSAPPARAAARGSRSLPFPPPTPIAPRHSLPSPQSARRQSGMVSHSPLARSARSRLVLAEQRSWTGGDGSGGGVGRIGLG